MALEESFKQKLDKGCAFETLESGQRQMICFIIELATAWNPGPVEKAALLTRTPF
jgi:hypothetical protein